MALEDESEWTPLKILTVIAWHAILSADKDIYSEGAVDCAQYHAKEMLKHLEKNNAD